MFVYVHVHPYINTSAVINRSGKECMVIFISTECAQTYIDFHGVLHEDLHEVCEIQDALI